MTLIERFVDLSIFKYHFQQEHCGIKIIIFPWQKSLGIEQYLGGFPGGGVGMTFGGGLGGLGGGGGGGGGAPQGVVLYSASLFKTLLLHIQTLVPHGSGPATPL